MARMWMVRSAHPFRSPCGRLIMSFALIEHYDATDAETKHIVPLKRLCWPA